LGRNGIPRAEIGVGHTFLGVLQVAQNVVGDVSQIFSVLFVAFSYGGLRP